MADVSIVHPQPPHIQFFHARADASGLYEMQSLPPGEKILIARAEGYGFAWKQVTLEPEDILSGVDFALEKAAVLEGQVVDEQGLPVAGATVRLAYKDMPAVVFNYLTGEAESDATGTYRLRNVTPSRDFYLEAAHPHFPVRFSEASLRARPGEALQAPLLGLHAGVTLSGTVLDAAGSPVQGAEIRLVAARLRTPSPEGVKPVGLAERLHRVVKTDANGQFAFEALEDGNSRLVVRHPQFVRYHQSVELERSLSAAQSVEIRLQTKAD